MLNPLFVSLCQDQPKREVSRQQARKPEPNFITDRHTASTRRSRTNSEHQQDLMLFVSLVNKKRAEERAEQIKKQKQEEKKANSIWRKSKDFVTFLFS